MVSVLPLPLKKQHFRRSQPASPLVHVPQGRCSKVYHLPGHLNHQQQPHLSSPAQPSPGQLLRPRQSLCYNMASRWPALSGYHLQSGSCYVSFTIRVCSPGLCFFFFFISFIFFNRSFPISFPTLHFFFINSTHTHAHTSKFFHLSLLPRSFYQHRVCFPSGLLHSQFLSLALFYSRTLLLIHLMHISSHPL